MGYSNTWENKFNLSIVLKPRYSNLVTQITIVSASAEYGFVAIGLSSGSIYIIECDTFDESSIQLNYFSLKSIHVFSPVGSSCLSKVKNCHFTYLSNLVSSNLKNSSILVSHHSTGLISYWSLSDFYCIFSFDSSFYLGYPAKFSSLLNNKRFLVLASYYSIIVFDIWLRSPCIYLVFHPLRNLENPTSCSLFSEKYNTVPFEFILGLNYFHFKLESNLYKNPTVSEENISNGLASILSTFMLNENNFILSLSTNNQSFQTYDSSTSYTVKYNNDYSNVQEIVCVYLSNSQVLRWNLTEYLCNWITETQFYFCKLESTILQTRQPISLLLSSNDYNESINNNILNEMSTKSNDSQINKFGHVFLIEPNFSISLSSVYINSSHFLLNQHLKNSYNYNILLVNHNIIGLIGSDENFYLYCNDIVFSPFVCHQNTSNLNVKILFETNNLNSSTNFMCNYAILNKNLNDFNMSCLIVSLPVKKEKNKELMNLELSSVFENILNFPLISHKHNINSSSNNNNNTKIIFAELFENVNVLYWDSFIIHYITQFFAPTDSSILFRSFDTFSLNRSYSVCSIIILLTDGGSIYFLNVSQLLIYSKKKKKKLDIHDFDALYLLYIADIESALMPNLKESPRNLQFLLNQHKNIIKFDKEKININNLDNGSFLFTIVSVASSEKCNIHIIQFKYNFHSKLWESNYLVTFPSLHFFWNRSFESMYPDVHTNQSSIDSDNDIVAWDVVSLSNKYFIVSSNTSGQVYLSEIDGSQARKCNVKNTAFFSFRKLICCQKLIETSKSTFKTSPNTKDNRMDSPYFNYDVIRKKLRHRASNLLIVDVSPKCPNKSMSSSNSLSSDAVSRVSYSSVSQDKSSNFDKVTFDSTPFCYTTKKEKHISDNEFNFYINTKSYLEYCLNRIYVSVLVIMSSHIVGGTSNGDIIIWSFPDPKLITVVPRLHTQSVISLVRVTYLWSSTHNFESNSLLSGDITGQIFFFDLNQLSSDNTGLKVKKPASSLNDQIVNIIYLNWKFNINYQQPPCYNSNKENINEIYEEAIVYDNIFNKLPDIPVLNVSMINAAAYDVQSSILIIMLLSSNIRMYNMKYCLYIGDVELRNVLPSIIRSVSLHNISKNICDDDKNTIYTSYTKEITLKFFAVDSQLDHSSLSTFTKNCIPPIIYLSNKTLFFELFNSLDQICTGYPFLSNQVLMSFLLNLNSGLIKDSIIENLWLNSVYQCKLYGCFNSLNMIREKAICVSLSNNYLNRILKDCDSMFHNLKNVKIKSEDKENIAENESNNIFIVQKTVKNNLLKILQLFFSSNITQLFEKHYYTRWFDDSLDTTLFYDTLRIPWFALLCAKRGYDNSITVELLNQKLNIKKFSFLNPKHSNMLAIHDSYLFTEQKKQNFKLTSYGYSYVYQDFILGNPMINIHNDVKLHDYNYYSSDDTSIPKLDNFHSAKRCTESRDDSFKINCLKDCYYKYIVSFISTQFPINQESIISECNEQLVIYSKPHLNVDIKNSFDLFTSRISLKTIGDILANIPHFHTCNTNSQGSVFSCISLVLFSIIMYYYLISCNLQHIYDDISKQAELGQGDINTKNVNIILRTTRKFQMCIFQFLCDTYPEYLIYSFEIWHFLKIYSNSPVIRDLSVFFANICLLMLQKKNLKNIVDRYTNFVLDLDLFTTCFNTKHDIVDFSYLNYRIFITDEFFGWNEKSLSMFSISSYFTEILYRMFIKSIIYLLEIMLAHVPLLREFLKKRYVASIYELLLHHLLVILRSKCLETDTEKLDHSDFFYDTILVYILLLINKVFNIYGINNFLGYNMPLIKKEWSMWSLKIAYSSAIDDIKRQNEFRKFDSMISSISNSCIKNNICSNGESLNTKDNEYPVERFIISTPQKQTDNNDIVLSFHQFILKLYCIYQNKKFIPYVLPIFDHLVQYSPKSFTLGLGYFFKKLDKGYPFSCRAISLIVYYSIKYKKIYELYFHILIDVLVKYLDPIDSFLRKHSSSLVSWALTHLLRVFPMLRLHQNTQRLALGTCEGYVIVYNLEKCSILYANRNHEGSVSVINFSDNGDKVASYSFKSNDFTVSQILKYGLLMQFSNLPQSKIFLPSSFISQFDRNGKSTRKFNIKYFRDNSWTIYISDGRSLTINL